MLLRPNSIPCALSDVKKSIHTVYQSTDQRDAYQLSMSLLASVQVGDTLSVDILPKMVSALETLSAKKSFKAWLMGRLLLAADGMKDNALSKKLQKNLRDELEEKDMPQDEFSAWAWGYLAGSSEAYEQAKKPMMDAVTQLVADSKKSSADALSNIMWALVIIERLFQGISFKSSWIKKQWKIISIGQHSKLAFLNQLRSYKRRIIVAKFLSAK